LLDGGWLSDGFADTAQSDAHRRRSRQLVEAYVADLDPAAEPAGVERTVATRTDLIAVSGRIDRLDDRRQPGQGTGDLVVVDYKTGRHRLTVDHARTSLALALYALAASRVLRRSCTKVELHHLPTASVLAWEHTPESLARQLGRAEDIAAECAAADERYKAAAAGGAPADEVFSPRPGPGCGWCDFRASCPEGSLASPQRRPWDGLGLAAGDDDAASAAAAGVV
jgi:putative RecB family exonuclease